MDVTISLDKLNSMVNQLEELKKEILNALDEYKDMSAQQLKDDRYSKFRRMGVFNS